MSLVSPINPYNSPIDFRLPLAPDPSSTPPELMPSFTVLYNAMQQTVQAFNTASGVGSRLPEQWPELANQPASTLLTGNLSRVYLNTFIDIAFGQFVCFAPGPSGTVIAVLADASNPSLPADGFCNVSGGVAAGTSGEFIHNTGALAFGNLTPGTRYYLSDVQPGAITATPPTTAGHISQYLGIALDTVNIAVNIRSPTTL